jgi:hypothetical protein
MSKPNLLGFSSSIGIYRNKRLRDLRLLLLQKIPRKIDFAELAPELFQICMAYAGENQIDGNFEGYDPAAYVEIFASNHVRVSAAEAATIKKAFEAVGLFEGDKIRSWAKYNKHFATHEQILKAKRKAGKIWQKKRAQEAEQQLKNPEKPPTESAPQPQKNGHGSREIYRDILALEKAIVETPEGSPQRRELSSKRKKLLGQYTGVDLKKSQPTAPAPPAKRHKARPGDLLMMARQTLADAPDMLSASMARALIKVGELPEALKGKFGKLLEQPEKETGHNPVPG